MSTSTLTLPVDAWAEQAAPSRNHGTEGKLWLDATANVQRQAFVSFAGLPPASASIFTAVLELTLADNWAGAGHTIVVERVTSRWAESALAWQNRPSVIATGAVTAPASGAAGTKVQVDVSGLLRAAITAGQRFGYRLRSGDNGKRAVYSSEAGSPANRPTLTIEWSTAPVLATDLVPSGGQSVSKVAPWVSWTYLEALRGVDAQAKYQVQVDDAIDFATPLFDSGQVTSGDSDADLAALGWAGGAAGQHRWWRVKVADGYGNWSLWSNAADFYITPKGTLAITAPAAVVESDSPTVTHTFTPYAGTAQQSTAYTVQRLMPDGSWSTVYSSGRRASTATSFDIPAGYITVPGATYRITVTVWDNADRATTPGDPPSVSATVQFTFSPTGTGAPTPVTGLTVTPDPAGGPGVVVAWSKTAIPDAFQLQVDAEYVGARLVPADVSAGGSNYSTTLYIVGGWQAHTVRVLALLDSAGKWLTSIGNPSVVATPRPVGIWLVDDGLVPVSTVQVLGNEQPSLAVAESSEVFRPVGRPDPVILRDSVGGLEGSIAGAVASSATYDKLATMVADGRTVRLVFGRVNIPVMLRALGYGAQQLDPEFTGCSFEVYQVGEFS